MRTKVLVAAILVLAMSLGMACEKRSKEETPARAAQAVKQQVPAPLPVQVPAGSFGIPTQTTTPTGKAAPQNPPTITITGTLVFTGQKPFMGPLIIAAPVSKEQEQANATTVDLNADALNKYKSELDANGTFRLRVDRTDFAGKKAMLLFLFFDDRRLQPMKINGANVVLKIDDATQALDLGKIVVK